MNEDRPVLYYFPFIRVKGTLCPEFEKGRLQATLEQCCLRLQRSDTERQRVQGARRIAVTHRIQCRGVAKGGQVGMPP